MSSEIKANSIQDKTGTRVLASDSGSAWSWGSGLPSGSIVQVQFTQYGDGGSGESGDMSSLSHNTNYVLQSGGNTSGGSQTGILDVNITPRIYGSKIWLQCHWMGELSVSQPFDTVWFFWRNTTKLASAVTADQEGEKGISLATASYGNDPGDHSSTPEVLFMQYFDTHGQSQSEVNSGTQIIYKVGFVMHAGPTRITTNRTIGGTHEVGVSSICAIELAP